MGVSNPGVPASVSGPVLGAQAFPANLRLTGNAALTSDSSGATIQLDTGGGVDGDIVFIPATSGTNKGFRFGNGPLGVFAHASAAQQTPVGSRAGNAALASLLTALAAYGLIVDGTSA